MHSRLPFRALMLALALVPTSMAVAADSTAELLAKGDVEDRDCKPAEALKYYLPIEKSSPNDVALLLRIARQYRHLMCDTTDPKQRVQYGTISLVYAKRAAKLAPNNSEAQLSPAISYGKMLRYQGKKEQVAASPLIKAAADKAIKLDPRNDSAWHVLGRWHQSVAAITGAKRAMGEMIYGKLPTGTNAEAIDCYDKAIALNPKRLRHYIGIGRTYAQMGDTATAKKYLEKGMKMPNVEKDDFELKDEGRKALSDL